ncbi:MAG: VOC family protein [Calditrichota bacterium]
MSNQPLTMRPYTMAIQVMSLERACSFYRDKLGLTCAYLDRTLRFMELLLPGHEQRFTLAELRQGDTFRPCRFQGPCPIFMSEDIEGDRTELERRGVPVGPITDFGGIFAFSITDPDGNECAVAQLMQD